MNPINDYRYTKPHLRREIRDRLLRGNLGGQPGEWTAKKAQLLVREYERRGGGYRRNTIARVMRIVGVSPRQASTR